MSERADPPHVFSFEAIGPELEFLPLASRRALDCAGLRLPLEGWRSLSLEDRRKLALAGVADVVDVAMVAAITANASPPAERIDAALDPDPRAVPPDLLASNPSAATLEGGAWSRLRPLDRYALVHAYRRSVLRADVSIFESAFEGIVRVFGGAPSSVSPTMREAHDAGAPSDFALDDSEIVTPVATAAGSFALRSTSPAGASPPSTAALDHGAQPPSTELQVDLGSRAHEPLAAFSSARVDLGSAGDPRQGSPPRGASPGGSPRPRKTLVSASEPPPAPEDASSLSSHLDASGKARMVDVGEKPETLRRAVASGIVRMRPETVDRIARADAPKGDVLATARIAGIMAAKRTPDLIPLCHGIALTHVAVQIEVDTGAALARVTALAEARDRTGVEMEAMVAVSVACLTIYDMLKGIDREMTIDEIKLLEKSGGRSGHFMRRESGEGES